MPDFNVRSDSVNVEQLMEQIRGRIREKRGVDYTEQQLQELANVKLEKFLDPRGVRSDLVDQYRKARPPYNPPELPNYRFEAETLFESHRGPLRLIRKLLNPLLKLFFNPNPLIQALNIQSHLNTQLSERQAKQEAARHGFDQLNYEVIHNLVLETTRLGIEVKNLKMRVESLTSRLEFNERRARSLESVVVYKPAPEERHKAPAPMEPPPRRDAPPPPPPREAVAPIPAADAGAADAVAPAGNGGAAAEGPGQRSRRRRRRRGRRGGGSAAAQMGGPNTPQAMTDAGSDEAEGDIEAEASMDDEGGSAEEAGSQEPAAVVADAAEAPAAAPAPAPDTPDHES